MSNDENKDLWKFVGAVETRLKNGDKQFEETKLILTELKKDVMCYHKKLDKHLTIHKYFNRAVASIASFCAVVWRTLS